MAAALYTTAAKILEKVLKKQGTAKSLVTTSHYSNKKKLLALVCQTLKYKTIIEDILIQTKLLKLERELKHSVALVLLYDFLFGCGIHCGGTFRQCIIKHKSSLSSALARLKVKAKVASNEELLPKELREKVPLPRYVRVNTLKTSVEKVIKIFEEDGFKQLDSNSAGCYKQLINGPSSFMCDVHLPDVLVFSPGTDLHDNKLYLSGELLLQDKASCFPALVLNPPAGAHVIDACSAPGNKTSHLASLMQNHGKVFAFDIDHGRLETLKKQMNKAGASCVTAKNIDFLKVNPLDAEYRRVEYILVDPSCSGSGIVSRMDHLIGGSSPQENLDARLESLANFQLTAVKHAMSFPSVKRVVYSTCSVHQQENEEVVQKALEECHGRFQLGRALPIWTRRGLESFPEADRCVRASPEDHTNGFFVALFERREGVSSDFIPKTNTTTGMVGAGKVHLDNNNSNLEVNHRPKTKKTKRKLLSSEYPEHRKLENLVSEKNAARKKAKLGGNPFSSNSKHSNTEETHGSTAVSCEQYNTKSVNLTADKALLFDETTEFKIASCSNSKMLTKRTQENSTGPNKKNRKKKRKRRNPVTV